MKPRPTLPAATPAFLQFVANGGAIVAVVLVAFVVLVVRRPKGLEPILVLGVAFPLLYAASEFTFFTGVWTESMGM